ncbi:flavin reductase family protein [Jatrophihabitans sp. DSM 45814]
MTADLSDAEQSAAEAVLAGLRPFPVAITTVSQGRANGLISLSAGSASVLREAPRVQISLAKRNFTHDLVKDSGVFVMHLLADGDPGSEVLAKSLAIIMGLGGSSGRDGDKIAQFGTKPGVTDSPVLLDALSYVEARVIAQLDLEESTLFIGDIVAAERLQRAPRLNIGNAWKALPVEWTQNYDRNLIHEYNAARQRRGLPEQPEPE